MNGNKTVIFDLDGTLLDTLPDIAENINIMLKHYGYPERSYAEMRKFIGCGARNLVKDSIGVPLSEKELDERLAYYNEIYTASSSPATKLFDGVAEMLEGLKARGYKIAVLTNKPQATTDRVVKEHLSRAGFDLVVGQREGVKIKPDKEAALYIMKTLGASPENTYMVGDGETDVMTAVNAGIHGVAVLWGYRDKDELEAAGAKIFVSSPKELFAVIS